MEEVDQLILHCKGEVTRKFLVRTYEYLNNHMEEMGEKVLDQFDVFLKKLVEIQQKENIQIAQIRLSFLYTSLYFDKPIFKIEAYENTDIWSRNCLEGEMELVEPFIYWSEYQCELQNLVEQNNMKQSIGEEQLRVISYQAIHYLLYYLCFILKYSMRKCEALESFNEVKKSAFFYISIGEYGDWQKDIYIQKLPVDIFQCDEDENLNDRQFYLKRYRQKDFASMDLTGSTFTECQFVNCHFEDSCLNDCRFIACQFQNVDFTHTKFYGGDFQKCIFQKVRVIESFLVDQETKHKNNRELYKRCEFVGCQIDDLTFERCELIYSKMVGCEIEAIQVIDSAVQFSDFETYVI